MEELKKDKECLHCEKFFDCAGKPDLLQIAEIG